VDFSFEYNNDFPANIERHTVMIKVRQKDGSFEPKAMKHCEMIAFNAKFLLQIISQHTGNGPVKIKLWAETKATIINDSFLLMPLMLNN